MCSQGVQTLWPDQPRSATWLSAACTSSRVHQLQGRSVEFVALLTTSRAEAAACLRTGTFQTAACRLAANAHTATWVLSEVQRAMQLHAISMQGAVQQCHTSTRQNIYCTYNAQAMPLPRAAPASCMPSSCRVQCGGATPPPGKTYTYNAQAMPLPRAAPASCSPHGPSCSSMLAWQ
jgi:hypothetical protein